MGPSGNEGSQPQKKQGFGEDFLSFFKKYFFSLFSFLPLFSSGQSVLGAFFFVPIYTVQFHLRIMLELCSLFVVLALRLSQTKSFFIAGDLIPVRGPSPE